MGQLQPGLSEGAPPGLGRTSSSRMQCDRVLLGPAGTKQSELGGSFRAGGASKHESNRQMPTLTSNSNSGHRGAKNSWEQTHRHGLNPTSYDKLDPHEQQDTTSYMKDDDFIHTLELVSLDSIRDPQMHCLVHEAGAASCSLEFCSNVSKTMALCFFMHF